MNSQPLKLRSLILTALVILAGAAATAAPAAAATPRPQLGRTVVVFRVRGRVIASPPGGGFSAVRRPQSLRLGGLVDSTRGVAGVTIATPSRERTAQLSHGSAQVQQTAAGTTTFRLVGRLDCAQSAGVSRHRPGHSSRSLWVGDSGGPFVSRGQYISGAARGTLWITSDYCNRSVIRVLKGAVLATNLITHQKVLVTAGHSYTAAVLPRLKLQWSSPAPISNGSQLTAISCPTAGFCAAVNGHGDVVTSTNPAGGAGTWTTTSLVSDPGLNDISCPTAAFCVASDALSGDVLVSTDPTGGPSAWTATPIVNPDGDGIEAITCPSRGLCVAVDLSGNVITTTDPTGGAGAWSLGSINPGNAFSDVACAGGALCVAVGAGLSASTDPNGGSGTWRTSTAFFSLSALACPSAALCVVGDANGNVYTSTDPAAGPAAYRTTDNVDRLHPFQPITGVSCTGSGDCVVVGLSGDAVTSADPTAGARAWSSSTIDSSGGLTGVSCPQSGLCFATDQAGDLLVGKAG